MMEEEWKSVFLIRVSQSFILIVSMKESVGTLMDWRPRLVIFILDGDLIEGTGYDH